MATKGINMFNLKTFCVVTGASKGLGRTIAIRFAEKFPPGSQMVLIARSLEGLRVTASAIEKDRPDIRVKVLEMDLGQQDYDSMDRSFNRILKEMRIGELDFEQALLVHNAASLGDVSKLTTELDNSKELREYWDLNLTSVILLNTVFFRSFSCDNVKQRVVINISSICSLQPFKSWSMYCAGKAARDMLFKTLAVEDPSIRVLNYAPGPIDTDMQVIARKDTADTELRTLFLNLKSEQKLLSTDESVGKLIPFLEKNRFDSGSHVDYYDI